MVQAFLGIPYEAAIVVVFFMVMVYTMIVGFISAVKTNAVQGVMMILAAILLLAAAPNLSSERLDPDVRGRTFPR